MKIKLFILVYLSSFFVPAQNKAIDSLLVQLKNANSDIVRSTTLNNLENSFGDKLKDVLEKGASLDDED